LLWFFLEFCSLNKWFVFVHWTSNLSWFSHEFFLLLRYFNTKWTNWPLWGINEWLLLCMWICSCLRFFTFVFCRRRHSHDLVIDRFWWINICWAIFLKTKDPHKLLKVKLNIRSFCLWMSF
jgi:hypothetical protein